MTKQKVRNRKEKIREKNFREVTNAFVKRCFRGYWVFVTTYNKQNWYAFCPFSTSPKC